MNNQFISICTRESKGYITLLGVLVVGSVAIATTLGILLSGIDVTKASLLHQQRVEAFALASACTEQALGTIRTNPRFVGSGGLSLGQGSCTYVITSTGVESRIIDSTGSVGTIVRKVKVMVNDINPQIVVASWQEVTAF